MNILKIIKPNNNNPVEAIAEKNIFFRDSLFYLIDSI